MHEHNDARRSPRADGGSSADRLVICNPSSGSEDHLEAIQKRATAGNWELRVTEAAGDARAMAREAAKSGLDLVGAAGGDGTINEVVDGFLEADAETWPTLVLIPAGTGNNLASNLGVEGISAAFSLADRGERRRLDLGIANGREFCNSCIGGLTAEASLETDSETKRRFGVLAYVLQTLETAANYDGSRLRVTPRTAGTDRPCGGKARLPWRLSATAVASGVDRIRPTPKMVYLR